MTTSKHAFLDAQKWLIFGLGNTGLSAVRFLHHKGAELTVFDTRSEPPYKTLLEQELPDVCVVCESWSSLALDTYDALLVSPGIALCHPLIQAAQSRGLPICGDIELFAHHNQKGVIAISGSNGKSTVTGLVGAIAESLGVKAVVGGNFGPPALDCLWHTDTDSFVFELSSFQLALTESLEPEVACLTNVAPDHLDWHGSFENYKEAKHKIWQGAKRVVFNREEPHALPPEYLRKSSISIGHFPPQDKATGEVCYWLHENKDDTLLVRENQTLMAASELSLMGAHNHLNVMMALAIGEAMGWPVGDMMNAVKDFSGLQHRCERVADVNGVTWVNDSKATNIAAVVAALSGLGPTHKHRIIWIAGGQGKGENFSDLKAAVSAYVKKALFIGESSSELTKALDGSVLTEEVGTLKQAVSTAGNLAEEGDLVLLSPACASFDQFANYEVRGEAFRELVLHQHQAGESL